MRNLALTKKYTPEQYAEMEKSSEERLEFFDGNVWSMAGASPDHETIVINTGAELKNASRGRNCRVYGSNLRVKVPDYAPYRYPDLSAVCGEPVFEDFFGLQMLVNPSLIVEILSPSTEVFDLNDKFTFYKSIESFSEYLLIAQDRPHIILYTKQSADAWLHREFNSLNEKIFLTSLGCGISAAEIYAGIEFAPLDPPRFPFNIENYR